MKCIQNLIIVTMIYAISGCGGGGSSDGGGSERIFTGSETVTLSTNGASETASSSITIRIVGNKVTLTDSDRTEFKGSLNGNALTASGIVALGDIGDGIICAEFPLGYKGTLNGENINGTLAGTLRCTARGTTIPFKVSGTFKASTGGAARLKVTGSSEFENSIRSLMQ